MNQPVGVGILGCGVVGQGVAQLLLENAALYAHRIGQSLEVRAIAVRDLTKDRGVPSELLTSDPMEVVRRPDVQIVVELMGGVTPAKDLILEALRLGKRVVTANKEVIAKYGQELFEAANQNQTAIYLEGSVGGGIPIVLPLKRSLVSNRVESILGIINGTTNYILSQMASKGLGYEEVLADAQRLGYAEADPGADVDGHDAAYKISILGSLFLGKRVKTEEVFREGIRRISHADIRYADELGYTIKLLGIAKNVAGDRLDIRVHPTMIPKTHPLSSVSGVTNAIAVRGDAVGEVMFIGPGAGRMPTASAVVADILNAAGSLDVLEPLMTCHHTHSVEHLPIEEVSSRYYIRLLAEDLPGVLGRLGMVFAEHGVSIHYFMQKENNASAGGPAVLVIVTHRVQEQAMRKALAAIAEYDDIREVANVIRVEEE